MRVPLVPLSRLLLLAAASGAGCSLGFDRFDATADGGPDSTSGDDAASADSAPVDGPASDDGGGDAREAAIEASCGSDCVATATACGAQCAQQAQQCSSECDGGGFCLGGCMRTHQNCSFACANTCISCTTVAGCEDRTGCQNASM